MIDYPALIALAEISRRGSFEAAAHALGITQPAVSQRIKTLESRIGQVLLDRGPPVIATPAGQQLIAHLDQVRLLEAGLSDQIDTGPVPAIIRIAINADSLASWAMSALSHTPGLIDLVIDDQDHSDGWLRAGLVSAAVTAQSGPVTGCDSYALGSMRYLATASPDFMHKHFVDGITPEVLRRTPAVTFNGKDSLQDQWVRRNLGQRIALPTHMIPVTGAFADATRLGMGWGMNPEILVAEDLRTGRLVELLPDTPLLVPLYWQIVRIMAPSLAPLTRAIRRAAQTMLHPA
ncbi:MAG: LysR family transcriptional regulator ArgP [Paracoccus sp. (in: a-proteobacteria)]